MSMLIILYDDDYDDGRRGGSDITLMMTMMIQATKTKLRNGGRGGHENIGEMRGWSGSRGWPGDMC